MVHLFPISQISPSQSQLQRNSCLWNIPDIYRVTCMSFCTTQKKARPCLIPPTQPQTQFSLSPALQDSHHKSQSPVSPILSPAIGLCDLNLYTWVWGHKCKQKSGYWEGCGWSRWVLTKFGTNLSKNVWSQINESMLLVQTKQHACAQTHKQGYINNFSNFEDSAVLIFTFTVLL